LQQGAEINAVLSVQKIQRDEQVDVQKNDALELGWSDQSRFNMTFAQAHNLSLYTEQSKFSFDMKVNSLESAEFWLAVSIRVGGWRCTQCGSKV
jgi:hypothetical protein